MPSVEELLNEAEAQSVTNDVLVVNVETREIEVPSTEYLFGVETDKKAERKHFRIPKKVGNGLDLENANIYVMYQNANGQKDLYVVTDKTVKGENVEFSWELYDNVTMFKGEIYFAVCAKWSSGGIVTNKWNTTLSRGMSLQGLDADEQVKKRIF